jgi:hypothetical protein
MLKLVCLIIVSVLCVSCSNSNTKNVLQERVNYLESHIGYIQDTRTNICFSVIMYAGYIDTKTMTCVPCEQIHESLIMKKDLK